jgi:hypothetical protein
VHAGPVPAVSRSAVDLYWIPLGAGGSSVRLNGPVFEAVQATFERRTPRDLYHSALVVRSGGERYAVEIAPIPRGVPGTERGVAVEGPVGSRLLSRFRVFRYELRCRPDGVVPDIHEAVDSARRLSADPRVARRLLDLVHQAPALVWGRDELGAGEMWTCNSVIAWLVAASGLPADAIRPPAGGRAPGWDAGIEAARRLETLPAVAA